MQSFEPVGNVVARFWIGHDTFLAIQSGTVMTGDIQAIANEVFATIGTGRQISPFTSWPAGLTLGDVYQVTALLNRKHEARGEKRLGRKIGFTNRTIWEKYKVYEPIWGYVYDSTVHDLTTATVAADRLC